MLHLDTPCYEYDIAGTAVTIASNTKYYSTTTSTSIVVVQ